MADSIEIISAQLRTQFPYPQHIEEDGVQRDMTLAEYDQWIADQAFNIRQQQLADEAEAARAEIRRQLRLLLPTLEQHYLRLDGGGTISATDQRRISADTTRAVYWIGRALVDRGIVESAPSALRGISP